MEIKHVLIATLVITFTAIPFATSSAEETKPPVKAAKTEEKKEVVKPYKLDTCIVSDEKLDGMGEPFVFTYQGQEIKMCCKKCKGKFDKDPASYLKKLEVK
ncbi:MAG: hypothetical protein H8M99_02795 [Gloeobacteraceae cyanobacterium ES-bin-144]|nr:hypothetical protein [Verrucomicrobiales bacterium]